VLKDKAAARIREMQENAQEALEIALANSRKTPLEFMLDAMNNESYPPGFRGEMAEAAAPFVHSKAPDAQPEKPVWRLLVAAISAASARSLAMVVDHDCSSPVLEAAFREPMQIDRRGARRPCRLNEPV
jgi:hypothetical protein